MQAQKVVFKAVSLEKTLKNQETKIKTKRKITEFKLCSWHHFSALMYTDLVMTAIWFGLPEGGK